MSGVSDRKVRTRRRRSLTESLLSIVLLLEFVLLFFVTLTTFGLKSLEPGLPAWAALPIGGAFMVVLLIATQVQRYRWGVAVGWVLQAGILALGFVTPLMFVVGALFVALWIFCFVKARQLTATPPAPSEGVKP
ncbi:MAG: DUF4233 domain-containing protein [Leifsonia sp.]|nr:DUF4233 domain-containing protein [Leifsonia sp.]